MSEETQRRREKKNKAGGGRQRGRKRTTSCGEQRPGILFVMDGSSWGEEEKKEGGGHISHGGFEYKQFLPSILFRATMLALKAAAPVEHSTHLLNKTECRNQRRRVGPPDRGKIWIFAAAVC